MRTSGKVGEKEILDQALEWKQIAPGAFIVAFSALLVFASWKYLIKPVMEFAVKLRDGRGKKDRDE